jgi:hypothetical protein
MNSSNNPSRLVQLLGYTGLIPFVTLALAVWFGPPHYQTPAAQALLGYGACILSFLGAIYWGLNMRDSRNAPQALWIWGVSPSLIAWVALLVPLPFGLWLIAAGLVTCLIVDKAAYLRFGAAPWLPMRLVLTVVASASCLAGAWACAN